ncbi:unnamed protein product [Cuscuta epithymum]|nr:unnamed protein product [Cuscuta epithymum]
MRGAPVLLGDKRNRRSASDTSDGGQGEIEADSKPVGILEEGVAAISEKIGISSTLSTQQANYREATDKLKVQVFNDGKNRPFLWSKLSDGLRNRA